MKDKLIDNKEIMSGNFSLEELVKQRGLEWN